MSFNFIFPVAPKDLLKKSAVDQYTVEDVPPMRIMKAKVHDLQMEMRSLRGKVVLTHFDTLFAIIHLWGECANDLKEDGWQCVLKAAKLLESSLGSALEKVDAMEKEEIMSWLNCIKMTTYLICEFIRCWEEEVTQQTTVAMSGRGKKKKAAMAGAGMPDWDEEKEIGVAVLLSLIRLPIHRVWDMNVVEDEFVRHICNLCFRLLENQATVKSKNTKDSIFHMLGSMLKKKYIRSTITLSVQVCQGLQQKEHLASQLAQAVHLFSTDYSSDTVAPEILREIGKVDSSELTRDLSAARSYSQFCIELAEKCPAAALSAMPNLAVHLENEPYTMRNGMLCVIGEVIIQLLSKDLLDDKAKITRDSLLDTLEDHVHDVNAFVRGKTLQVWTRLVNEKALPLARQPVLLELVIGRLMDKSSNVRKNAVQLLTTVLQSNPFAAQLSVDELEIQLEKEELKLEDLRPQFVPPLPVPDKDQPPDDGQSSNNSDKDSESDEKEEVEEAAEVEVTPSQQVQCSQDAEQDAEFAKQKMVVDYLKDAVKFTRQLYSALPIMCQLLGSRLSTDVFEAISFFVTGFEFGVTQCMSGIRRMLPLVWSREQGVKDAVVEAYRRLYMASNSAETPRVRALAVANNLTALLSGATLGDLVSMEQLIKEFVESGEMDGSVVQLLWERFTLKIPDTDESSSRAALMLLAMTARADPKIIKSNIDVVLSEGLGARAETDYRLAEESCIALQKLVVSIQKGGKRPEPMRFPEDHDLFKRLADLIVDGVCAANRSDFIPFMQQAVACVFLLAEHPDSTAADFLKRSATKLREQLEASDSAGVESGALARFLAVSGQVAFRTLHHLDVSILQELKRRRAVKEEESSNKRQSTSRTPASKDGEGDDEMGLAGATADDAEAEYITKICETDVVGGTGLLASITPLLIHVCQHFKKYKESQLRSSAALALAQFMMVSSEMCEEQLPLLFTLLEKSHEPSLRANTIIALGDLTFRFPNLIEPWTPSLYARLRDENVSVRKNTLKVLTHLVLNDMVKVKGQLSEMATCLVDAHPKISGLAKLFFRELARKGNALYNILPDIISRLADTTVGVDEQSFRTIMGYLLSYIQKDRQSESLIEKLCHRFRSRSSDREARDLAYCLSLMSYNEKSLRKLHESLPCFSERLADDQVYEFFLTIVNKSRKFVKPEAKTIVDELEVAIDKYHTSSADDRQAEGRVAAAVGRRATKTAKTPGRSRKKAVRRDVDDDEIDWPASQGSDFTTPARRASRTRKPRLVMPDDDDSDVELFNVDESPLTRSQAQNLNDDDQENRPPLAAKSRDRRSAAAPTLFSPSPTIGRASRRNRNRK